MIQLKYLNSIFGTANVLESLRFLNKPCTAIIITSDKAYENREQIWGIRKMIIWEEKIYIALKGAAELIIKSYFNFLNSIQK